MSKSNGNNNKSNSNSKSNGNSKNFLISKNQTSRFSAPSRASLTRTLYVSLDNADPVIEGGPLKPGPRGAWGWPGPYHMKTRSGVPRSLRFFRKGRALDGLMR